VVLIQQRENSEVDFSLAPLPVQGKIFQGEIGKMIEQFGLSRVGLSNLLLPEDKVKLPTTGELTYRGMSYKSPFVNPGEWKPGDWIDPKIIDQMKKNGVIKTALFLKKAPILAVIQKSKIKHPNPKVEGYLNYVLGPILYNLCYTSLFALDYGVSLHEKVFEAGNLSFKYDHDGTMRTFKGPSIHYKKIKWNNPRTIKEIKIQEKSQDFNGYTQTAGMRDIEISIDKSFMWGKGQENTLWGSSDLDAVYEYWYWLELLSGYYMRYMEKLATPPLLGYAPPGNTYSRDTNSSVENMSWLAEVASRLQDGMAIVMPSQFDANARHRLWELRELAMSTRGDLYQTAIGWLENAIFKGMFVPDKPVSQGTQSFGSYALADIQFEAFLVGEEWDLHSMVRNVERYVIRPLIDLNFGPQFEDAVLFYPPMSRELKQRVYEVFKDLIDGHPDYNAINFIDIANELGIPVYTDEQIKEKKKEAFEDATAMLKAQADANPQPEESNSGNGSSSSVKKTPAKKIPPKK